MTQINSFDVITATFQPRRTDDLKPHVRDWIGVRLRWCAAWEIDKGSYAGQMAMMPHEVPLGLKPIGWVPLCDLSDISDISDIEATRLL